METPASFPTLDALYFPSAQQSVSQTLSSLRRSALSISNRLQSIETDAAFVQEVAEHYDLPLIANERCGSWYIPPDAKTGSAYFKSTDGHAGVWDFSFRRLNLQLLPLAREHGGCVIVDSTRRGKCKILLKRDAYSAAPPVPQPPPYRKTDTNPCHASLVMPDALSKTVPIWCAVLNRALFPTETAFHSVQLPPNYLGESEESQIEYRIDGFVSSLKDLKLDLDDLRQQLGKPIRIAWANRSYFYPTDLYKRDSYRLFVLCSASKRVQGAEISEGGYIQGAGDDSEGWAHSLTPPVFWANHAILKQTREEDLPDLIAELIKTHEKKGARETATLISPTQNLFIGSTGPHVEGGPQYDLMIDCNGSPESVEGNPRRLNLGCASAKLGSRDLRRALSQVRDFVGTHLGADPSRSLLVTCETGKDLSAGALVAIICLFYKDDGTFDDLHSKRSINKQFIRQRLAWIVSSKHDVNPSRSTLQSVNAFLMQPPDY